MTAEAKSIQTRQDQQSRKQQNPGDQPSASSSKPQVHYEIEPGTVLVVRDYGPGKQPAYDAPDPNEPPVKVRRRI